MLFLWEIQDFWILSAHISAYLLFIYLFIFYGNYHLFSSVSVEATHFLYIQDLPWFDDFYLGQRCNSCAR